MKLRLKKIAPQTSVVLREVGIGTVTRDKRGWTATAITGGLYRSYGTRGEAVGWLLGLAESNPAIIITEGLCEKAKP